SSTIAVVSQLHRFLASSGEYSSAREASLDFLIHRHPQTCSATAASRCRGVIDSHSGSGWYFAALASISFLPSTRYSIGAGTEVTRGSLGSGVLIRRSPLL